MRRGAIGARVWEVRVFRHADVVCLCLVCILWQLSMLVEDARGDHMEKAYSRAIPLTAL